MALHPFLCVFAGGSRWINSESYFSKHRCEPTIKLYITQQKKKNIVSQCNNRILQEMKVLLFIYMLELNAMMKMFRAKSILRASFCDWPCERENTKVNWCWYRQFSSVCRHLFTLWWFNGGNNTKKTFKENMSSMNAIDNYLLRVFLLIFRNFSFITRHIELWCTFSTDNW